MKYIQTCIVSHHEQASTDISCFPKANMWVVHGGGGIPTLSALLVNPFYYMKGSCLLI